MKNSKCRLAPAFAARGATVGFAVLLLLGDGCGPDRPETISVYGQITLAGGEWPKPGRLVFATVEPAKGFPMRPGKALFDVDGRFTAFTWEEGDGLMPGTYKVGVECWEVEPTMESAGKSYVGAPYQSAASSPLELIVEPGQSGIKLNLDVPKP